MRVLLLLVAALAACHGSPAGGNPHEPYRGYKLVSVWPATKSQVNVVNAISQWHDADMFSHHVGVGGETVFMLPPATFAEASKLLREKGVRFAVTNEDLQESVNKEAKEQERLRIKSRSSGKATLPTFERYMRYDEIQRYLDEMVAAHPGVASVESAGKSFEGRDMRVIKISKSQGKASRAVFVDAGIHAREWIAPPVAIYLIQQLLEDNSNADLLDDMDWYIMPLVNPDGYEHTHTRERFWRKNRSTRSSRWCKGVDLNRNFGFHWAQAGVSHYPCDETYAGPKAYSEPESEHLKNYILKANKDKRIKMYLTLHSYGPYILFPWGYDANLPDADDKDELVSIANEANQAMVAAGSEPFTVQNSALLYPAAGASDDWSKGEGGIAKAYTIELPGGGSQGFNMPASRIADVTKQVFAGLRVFGLRAKKL